MGDGFRKLANEIDECVGGQDVLNSWAGARRSVMAGGSVRLVSAAWVWVSVGMFSSENMRRVGDLGACFRVFAV